MSDMYEIDTESAPSSVLLLTGKIAAEHTDSSGTIGMDGYLALVKNGLSQLLAETLGLGEAELAKASLISNVTHCNCISRNRLPAGALFELEARLVDRDERHLMLFFTIWSGDEIVAISELLLTLIDLDGQPQAFPLCAHESIEQLYARQEGLPAPFLSGATVGLPARD